jgi:Tol biopolymer transport system component
MPEHSHSSRRLLALTRYLSALEQGDIEALSAVLREACSDPLLSALLEEVDSLYQELDHTALAPLEARQIIAGVFQVNLNHHQAEESGAPFSLQLAARDIVPVPVAFSFQPAAQYIVPVPVAFASPSGSKEGTLPEDQLTQPLPALKRRRLAESSLPRRYVLLVAFLIVCLLVGSMAVVLQALGQKDAMGNNSLDAGKTLYSKQLGSLYSNIASIAWAPDGKRLASLEFNGVQIWDATTGAHAMLARITASFGSFQSLAWSPNGKWIAVAADGGIALIDAQNGKLVHEYTIASLAADSGVSGTPSSYSNVSGVAWSPDSEQLAVTDYITTVVPGPGHDHFLIINAQTGQPIHFFDLMGQSMAVTSWSPDGKYLAALVNGNSIWVWDATFQVVMQQSLDGAYPGYSMPGMFAWQPGTDNVLFARGNLFQGVWVGLEAPHAVLWNVSQNKLLKQYDIKNTGFFSWSANGRYFATGIYNELRDKSGQPIADQIAVFDAGSEQQIVAYNQSDWQVLNVVWSPDGRYLASCGGSYVRTWEL